MALILYKPAFWSAFILVSLILGWLAIRRRLRWWPAWLVRVVLITLVLLTIFSPNGEFFRVTRIPGSEVLVLDLSDSVSPTAIAQSEQFAHNWQSSAAGRMLVVFGDHAYPAISHKAIPKVDGRASNIKDALGMASALLANQPGRIILASDGLATSPELVGEAILTLSRLGQTLDVVPQPVESTPNNVALGTISAPQILWDGTPFPIVIPISGLKEIDKLRLIINGKNIESKAEALGGNLYRIMVPPQPQGIYTLEVRADVSDDPNPRDNSSFAVFQVFSAPRALFVSSSPEIASAFIARLGVQGIHIDTIGPSNLTTDLKELGKYKIIFLHNLLASQLTLSQMTVLQDFASNLGGGIIFLGGRYSYTLGGYKYTPLESMLPVRLDPPARPQRPPAIFLIVLDKSASMEINRNENFAPIDLAKEAAMRVAETLKSEDYLGLLTFNTEQSWDVPLEPLGQGEVIRQKLDAISSIVADGGTKMYAALSEALSEIAALPPGVPVSRNILLLSDGVSYDGDLGSFQELARQAANQNITISTIALGTDTSLDFLMKIAEISKGRFYVVSDPRELPQIMLSESRAARSDNIQLGVTTLRLGEPEHPILSGMSENQLPSLSGYVALSSKADQGAEDVLVSSSLADPILSVWQYGLGKIAAWMGDVGEEWTGQWPQAGGQGMFWTQVVRYILPNPAAGPAQVSVDVHDTSLIVEVYLQSGLANPINLDPVKFTYADPDGKVLSLDVPQVSPGTYSLEIPRPAPGAYRAVVSYLSEDKQQIDVPVPFAVNIPKEWQAIAAGSADAGKQSLTGWAQSAGGQVLTWDALTTPNTVQPDKIRIAATAWWFVLALVITWPIEIAIRRKWLPWT